MRLVSAAERTNTSRLVTVLGNQTVHVISVQTSTSDSELNVVDKVRIHRPPARKYQMSRIDYNGNKMEYGIQLVW